MEVLVLVNIGLINAVIPPFEGLKVNSHAFPTVVMTNTELAYIAGASSSKVQKFVFSITKAKEEETSTDFTINKDVNDDKSFFVFSSEDIDNAKTGGKSCEILADKEYKMSELQTSCASLYEEMNSIITSLSNKVTVEYYSSYHISIVSGYVDVISSEAANTLINLVKLKPTTYPAKSHFFKIHSGKGIYIKNDRIVYLLYDIDLTHISIVGNIETDKIISWVDKTDYSEMKIDRFGDNVRVATAIIYSLSSENSNIVHFKGITETTENIFLLSIGEIMSENDILTEITSQLKNVQDGIKNSYKQRIRMRNLDENRLIKGLQDGNAVDSWFYEEVTSDYYKGYFITGETFTYIEKTKSNYAKVLEKITFQKKIDFSSTESPHFTINDTDIDMKITLKNAVEQCSGNTEYKAQTIKGLCSTADPEFKEVIVTFVKTGDTVSLEILGVGKQMIKSTIQKNTYLMNLIGLETKAIPIGKYITHNEVYANNLGIDENHYYRILQRVEMDLSETDKDMKNYIKIDISLRERVNVGEYTRLGELYIFTLPNLDGKYLLQITLSDFYKYDSEFNSYSEIGSIITDTNNIVDSMIKRITDFIKDNDDSTSTTPNVTPNESAETTTDKTTETSSTTSETNSPDTSTTTLNDDSTISTNINTDTNTNSDDDDNITTTTTRLDDNGGYSISIAVISVIFVIILMI